MRQIKFIQEAAPRLLVFFVYITGVALLFSISISKRLPPLGWLEQTMSPLLWEASCFVQSLIGLILLFVAEGLRKRIDTAYFLTIGLLVVAATLELSNGLRALEATALLTLGLLLYTSRHYFHRKGSLFRMDYSPIWAITSALVLVSFVVLGAYLHRHVQYSDVLWWKIGLDAGAPRFLRMAVGIFVFLLGITFSRILSLAPPKFIPASEENWARVRVVLASSTRYSANLALVGDKSFIFSKSARAFLMYRVRGRSWISMGDPVGPSSEWLELIMEFRRSAKVYGGNPVFFEIDREHLSHYLDLGFHLMKIGQEARLFLPEFRLENPPYHDLRKALRKMADKEFTFEVLEPSAAAALFPELKKISGAWLNAKHTGEKQFSMGSFREDYLKNFPIALARLKNKPCAFANLWFNSSRDEFSADLMRYHPNEAPNGLMDYLFANLILWGQARGGLRWFNLGMVPLSGLEQSEFASLWLRLGNLIYRHGEHFYNFQGLRQYKEKFQPQWEPKYLAWTGNLKLPQALTDLSLLISGGYRGIFFPSARIQNQF